MKIFIHLVKEFWFPALFAAAWTAYNLRESSDVWDFKKALNIFAPSFFLFSWATGQFFRVKKQAHVERNLTSIEQRVESLVAKLEKHTKDFIGYSTGSDSYVWFEPAFRSEDQLELGLLNLSEYPVFDVHAELVDLDEPLDHARSKYHTRHSFGCESLFPNKILPAAYRIDVKNRERLALNIFIRTRSQSITQELRFVWLGGKRLVAMKTSVEGKVTKLEIPSDFPGADLANPQSVFEWPPKKPDASPDSAQ